MINEKVRKTLDELDNNGVVYLEYLGYSTSEEDEEQSEKGVALFSANNYLCYFL